MLCYFQLQDSIIQSIRPVKVKAFNSDKFYRWGKVSQEQVEETSTGDVTVVFDKGLLREKHQRH